MCLKLLHGYNVEGFVFYGVIYLYDLSNGHIFLLIQCPLIYWWSDLSCLYRRESTEIQL